MIENKLKLKATIIGFLLFILLTGTAMFVSIHYFDAGYGSLQMVRFMLPAEIAMFIICSIIITRYYSWKEIGFRVPIRKTWIWLLPVYLFLIVGWFLLFASINTMDVSHEKWNNFLTVGFVTMFVGISEEMMFRGIILHTLLAKMTAQKAVIVSAIAFSLLHSINIIAGMPLYTMSVQLVFSFIAGFYLATVMIKTKSIIPLIIWHWFWDFLSLGGIQIDHQSSGFMALITLIELIFGFILWKQLKTNGV
jgi:hypothetical protein